MMSQPSNCLKKYGVQTMASESSALVQKIWDYCNLLRDGGMSYGDYIDQLTSLLFLKMRDEQTKPPYNEKQIIPRGYGWNTLLDKRGSDLQKQYEKILSILSKKDGLLGLVYKDATNKIKKPANLERLIHDIDKEAWASLDLDVKGEIYEGLLEKHSGEAKGAAGQYFTPRALISAIVDVLDPKPNETICDPACGTGGFFLQARKYILKKYRQLDPNQWFHLKSSTFYGTDITSDVVRLCAMNMYLHDLATTKNQIREADSLQKPSDIRFDIVMTNPPFGGSKSPAYERDDFWTTNTKDKHLNFIQHVYSSLKINGRCGIVLPDGVLFGTTNAHHTIRQKMMQLCSVHTILRLPTGIFYANSVKANVVFFVKKRPRMDSRPWTDHIWFYDLRTDMNFTQKRNKMERHHLDDFVKCCTAKRRRNSERFRKISRKEIEKKGHWDITLMQGDSATDVSNLPEPKTLMADVADSISVINKAVKDLEKELRDVT